MARRIATTGHATVLGPYTNGNASSVVLELRTIEPNDTELVAQTKFMRAGEYAPESFGPIVDGALDSIKTNRLNEHRGVSVFDLPAKARCPGAAEAQNAIADVDVTPSRSETVLSRACGGATPAFGAARAPGLPSLDVVEAPRRRVREVDARERRANASSTCSQICVAELRRARGLQR